MSNPAGIPRIPAFFAIFFQWNPVHNCVMVIIEHRTSQNKEGTVWLLQISGKTEYGHSP